MECTLEPNTETLILRKKKRGPPFRPPFPSSVLSCPCPVTILLLERVVYTPCFPILDKPPFRSWDSDVFLPHHSVRLCLLVTFQWSNPGNFSFKILFVSILFPSLWPHFHHFFGNFFCLPLKHWCSLACPLSLRPLWDGDLFPSSPMLIPLHPRTPYPHTPTYSSP